MPTASLTAVWTPPTCSGLEAFTVTPGSTAPVVSFTVPVRVDVCTACANARGATTPSDAHTTASTGRIRLDFMPSLLFRVTFPPRRRKRTPTDVVQRGKYTVQNVAVTYDPIENVLGRLRRSCGFKILNRVLRAVSAVLVLLWTATCHRAAP